MIKSPIQAILWNNKKGELSTVEIFPWDQLKQMYELLDCDTIDITTRPIGGISYDIIVDDEGLLKQSAQLSLVNHLKPELVGNLLFAQYDELGEMRTLTKSEIEHFKKSVQVLHYINDKGELKAVLSHKDHY